MKFELTDGFDLNWPSPFKRLRHQRFALIGLFMAVLLIYSNSFLCEFHLDDFGNIVDNINIQGNGLTWQELSQSFYGSDFSRGHLERPLAFLSFALNYRLNGLDPFGYHVVNVFLHYAASVVLYLLLLTCFRLPALGERYTGAASGQALLAAFMWAIHPIHVSAVTYIVQRMAILAGLFYLLAMLFFAKARTTRQPGRAIAYGGISLVCGVCAFLSKENAVTLPVALALMEILLIRGWRQPVRKDKTVWGLIGGLAVLGVIVWLFMGANIVAGYQARPFTLTERLLTQPRVWLFYIGLLLYPTPDRMTLLYDVEISHGLLTPWTTLPALTILVATTVLALWGSRRWPMVAFSVLFFLLNQLVEGSVIPLEMVFEHRNYLPSAFFFVPVVIIVVRFLDHFSYRPLIQVLGATAVVVVLIANGHTTYDRNRIFRTELSLWEDNVRKSEHLHRPHHNLSKAYMVAGRYPEAIRQMELALEARAGGRTHQKYLTHYNFGLYCMLANDLEKAQRHLQLSLDYEPGNTGAFNNMARIRLWQDRIPEALDMVHEAIRRNPTVADYRHTLAYIALRLGNPDRALQEAVASRHMVGDRGSSDFIMGEALRHQGHLNQARFYFERYRVRYPAHRSARLALIEIYYLTDQKRILKQTVRELMAHLGDRELQDVLEEYHLKYNTLNRSRIDTIVRAIEQSLCDPIQFPK